MAYNITSYNILPSQTTVFHTVHLTYHHKISYFGGFRFTVLNLYADSVNVLLPEIFHGIQG